MGAGGTGIVYADEAFIRQGLDEVFGGLDQKNYLVGLDAADFFGELADMWGYLTQIHPFRDGNTRSQTAFIDRLSANAGHPIKWSGIEVDRLREHRLAAINRPRGLAAYLEQHALPSTDAS
ncbi:Fic family protein [Zhihengliuella halotolerans]|uniref:Fic family protein n=1 Tax=Zhihengliuella halotolerans TaxID=370736 RepID=UPI0013EE9365|nr:Fic family protein [Zhihengliuella halotolerans]